MTQTDGRSGRSACDRVTRPQHTSESQYRPLSPSSEGGHEHAVGKPGTGVKCFFAVLDPESTEKLRGTKNSACLGSFKSVNRLKEHIWRAHSPTHNCKYCRQKTTKPTDEFRKEHALCRPGNKITRPLPALISDKQAESLGKLNQHFNKPNDETVRCEKLWKALFPGEEFDKKRFVCSHGAEGADGEQPVPSSNHTSSPSRKTSQPTTPTRGSRPQNTPPASPIAPQGSGKAQDEPLFSVVKKPTGTVVVAKGTPSLDSGIDMGDDTNKQDTPSRRQSVDDSAVGSRVQHAGSGFPRAPAKAYARRLQVGEPGEDSTPATTARKGFEVGGISVPVIRPSSSTPTTTRSVYSESSTSQSDIEMSQSDDIAGGEDDDSDVASIGGDSAIGYDDMDLEMPEELRTATRDHMDAVRAINSRDYDIAASGCVWDSDDDVSMGSESEC